MKTKVTTVIATVLFATVTAVASGTLFLDAWDQTMTDQEVMYYLVEFPKEKKLQKLALQRKLISENEIVENVYIPKHDSSASCCDFENPDFNRSTWVIDRAILIYSQHGSGDDKNFSFDKCLQMAEIDAQLIYDKLNKR